MNRIKPLDGLRTLAVTGVIWAHVWMFFGTKKLLFLGIDVNAIISFGGIGVDLFFVISGFCMYLMYQKKSVVFSAESYKNFILNRWKRIAPAFYAAVLFDSLLYLFTQRTFPLKSFLSHLLFINTFNKDNVLSPPFWSLATEWHFYIILPLLFIRQRSGNEIVFRVLILAALSFVCRLVLFSNNIFLQRVTVNSDMIWYRFIEFGFGIIAAWYYTNTPSMPALLKGNRGFIISLLIAFAGRALMITAVLAHFGRWAFIGRALGEPLLTFGFALMILNVITSRSIFSTVLSSKPFLFIGRISYSMYLWHWFIAYNLSYWVINKYGNTQVSFYLTFAGVLLILIPISFISYKMLEAPYFKKNSTVKSGPGVAAVAQ